MAPPVHRPPGVVSSKEYATLRGTSPSYISKLKRLGKLAPPAVLSNGDINVVLANQMLGEAPLVDDTGVSPKATVGPNYAEERARREAADAQIRELELARRRGETVDKVDAGRATFAVFRDLRDGLLALPPRLAEDLAAETSPRLVAHRLTQAITDVLAAVARKLEGEAPGDAGP
jgi:hypothetical protein